MLKEHCSLEFINVKNIGDILYFKRVVGKVCGSKPCSLWVIYI